MDSNVQNGANGQVELRAGSAAPIGLIDALKDGAVCLSSLKKMYLSCAFESWLLKPASNQTDGMKMGRMNEPMVLPRIASFLKREASGFIIECMVESGLVGCEGQELSMLAGSPDGIAACRRRGARRLTNAESSNND